MTLFGRGRCKRLAIFVCAVLAAAAARSTKEDAAAQDVTYVKVGDDVKLLCNISQYAGEEAFHLAWHYVPPGVSASLSVPVTNGYKVSGKGKYMLNTDLNQGLIGPTGQYDLTVVNVTEEDSGLFICKVYPMSGTLQNVVRPLYVGREPAVAVAGCSQFTRVVGDMVHVAENEPAAVCCHDGGGRPPATTEWYWHATEEPLVSASQTSTLHLDNVSLTLNATRYECRAKNVLHVSKMTVQLLVEARPFVIDWWPKDVVHTYPLRTETLKCRHRGSPVPTVQWQFRPLGHEHFRPLVFSYSSAKYYSKNDANFSLCIRNLTLRDMGVYRCVLRNKLLVLPHDTEPPSREFVLSFAPHKPKLMVPDHNIYANACFVNWTITASNIDYYVLYARTLGPMHTQSESDQSAADAQGPSASSGSNLENSNNLDSVELSGWKHDNFSHIVDGMVYHSPRHGWKLFEGTRVLTSLQPLTVYQIVLQACYLNSCSISDRLEFRTKNESKPLRSIPFAVAIKQKQEGALTLRGSVAVLKPTEIGVTASISILLVSYLQLAIAR